MSAGAVPPAGLTKQLAPYGIVPKTFLGEGCFSKVRTFERPTRPTPRTHHPNEDLSRL